MSAVVEIHVLGEWLIPVTELRKNGVSVNVEWDQCGGNTYQPQR